MIYIIFALPDTVFCESSQPRSAPDKQKRAKKTFEEMITYIPGIYYTILDQPTAQMCRCESNCIKKIFISRLYLDFLGKCIGEEAKFEGVRLLFDGLQQPVLNKQVNKFRHFQDTYNM